MNNLPEGMTNFCDDIRREIDGKFTLVGVNPTEELLFKKNKDKKYMIPILGVHMRILIPVSYIFENLTIRIFQEENSSKKKIFEASQSLKNLPGLSNKESTEKNLYGKITLAHKFVALLCNPNGSIKVRMFFDKNEPIPMGSLEYKVVDEE